MEYNENRITSGGNTNVTAGERDLTVTGSAITGRDVSLTAKGNIRLEAGENTSITTTENKFSSASIGASFTPQGLSNISVNANKANSNSKESVTAYSPTLVSAENNLSLTSGKDMDIIGSKAQGDKITAKVGGNLNIETLQEKETYEEQNSSMGFGISWGVKAKDKQTSTKSTGQTQNPPTTNATKSTPKPNNTKVPAPTGRKFSAPNIAGNWNKGSIDAHYRSAREQSGFFAGNSGFDIYVKKNTELIGGIIGSEAAADKNKLSTGTLSFSDRKNEADYRAKSVGASYRKYGDYDNMTQEQKNSVYNTIGLAPNISMPAKGDAVSTTKAAVAAGTIDIRENPTQNISALSRDTNHALNELGRIFDKQRMEERQELAKVFGEEAYRLAHNMKDDGSGRKIAVHAVIGGIMSKITGNGFASGAAGAGLNEALINAIKGQDPGTAQIVSAIVGAAAAKAVGGNAMAGASAAASGTKWNLLSKTDYDEMNRRLQEAKTDAEQQAIKEEYQEKNKAQEENEQAEKEALIREGKSSNEIADFFNNKRYPNYVTFNGDHYLRTGDVNFVKSLVSKFTDYTYGITESIDENMSFGVMKELYKGVWGHYPSSSNTNAYHVGRLTGDVASMYLGLQEIAFGAGTMGGGIVAGTTGAGAVATPTLTATGTAAVAHGGISALQAWGNTKENLNSVLFSKSNMERGIGGKGWRGDRIWKENVKLVENGGTIERVNGEIISQSDAEILIKESKGTILRVEDGHMKGNNPHKFPHINYITRDGKRNDKNTGGSPRTWN